MMEKFLDYNITTDLKLIKQNLESPTIINTINAHSYVIAEKDNLFKKTLLSSNFLLPDGIGIVLGVFLFKRKKIKRITGAQLHSYFLESANDNKQKVFYLGSSVETLYKIKKKINLDYPNISIETYSPPFKDQFNSEDNTLICDKINLFNPDVLFVGMTAPKQEKWVYENSEKIKTKYVCNIGAVFDFFSGNIKRSPVFFQKIGLEWLHRSFMSKRLAKRNFSSNPKFIFHLLKSILKIK